MIKIRYHHLMCLPRYKGEGYSKDFCANMQAVKKSIENMDYTLVDTCDEICKACPNNVDGKCINENKVSVYDNKVKQSLLKNEILNPADICSDCNWFYICKNIMVRKT